MKIVQTFWTRPGLKAGWIDQRFNFFSWALSCLQLRKFYDNVELYTDTPGKELLIDRLKLPYSKVHIVLDDFRYPTHLWAASKILTYSLQKEPFLHVDGDVYLFHPFNSKRTGYGVVYQNREIERFPGAFYTNNIRQIQEAAGPRHRLPQWLQKMKLNHVEALNAGVLGGSDIGFFRELAATAFDFFDNYQHLINAMEHPFHANHVAEQVLAAYVLEKRGGYDHGGLFETNYFLSPDTMHLINNIPRVEDPGIETAAAPVPFGYQALNYFGISPYGRKYVHMMGFNKRTGTTCTLLCRRLRANYPAYYQRIMDYCSTTKGSQPASKGLAEKVNRLSPGIVFKRTIYLYGYLTGNLLPLPDNLPAFIRAFPALLANLEETQAAERLADIFNFESQRYYYAAALNDQQELDTAETLSLRSMDVIYSPTQAGIDNYLLTVNPLARGIAVKWNWLDSKMFGKTVANVNPATIVILPEEITASILEIDLTAYNQALYGFFKHGATYGNGLSAFEQLVQHTPPPDLTTTYFQCIIYMITNRILLVQTPTDIYERKLSLAGGAL